MSWIQEQEEIFNAWKVLYGFKPTFQEVREVKRRREAYKRQSEQEIEGDPELFQLK